MNFYRKKDSELGPASTAFHTLIAAAPVTYGLVAAQATAYGALNTAWLSAYAATQAETTRTKVTIAGKNQARKNLVSSAMQLGNFIRGNLSVNNDQLIALGLTPRQARQPIPAPDMAPGIHIASVVGLTVTIRLDDPDETRRGMPSGVSGASVFSFIGPTPPAGISGWEFEGNVSKPLAIIVLPDGTAPGAKVWFTAFYFNNRKQSGPPTFPVSTNVQGGGVSMAA